MKNTFKKTVSLILALMMLFSCLALGASAKDESAVSFSFSADQESYVYGDTVVFTVSVANNTAQEKSFLIEVEPKHEYIFNNKSFFNINNVSANSVKTLFYTMKVEKAEKTGFFGLVSRLIKSIGFIFTKFDYKETIKVEGRNRPIGFNVSEIEVTERPVTPSPDIDAPEIEMSAEAIAAEYNRVVNELKAYKGKVSIDKTETIDIAVTDSPGGQVVLQVLQPIVDSFTGTWQNEYEFENGENLEGRSINTTIEPFGKNSEISAEALSSAKAYEDENDSRILCLVIVPEDSAFDGKETTIYPTYHSLIASPLNLSLLDLSPVVVEKADMYYPGATVTAVIDSQGRLIALQHILPIEGSVRGNISFISATVGLAGSMTTDWAIEYK